MRETIGKPVYTCPIKAGFTYYVNWEEEGKISLMELDKSNPQYIARKQASLERKKQKKERLRQQEKEKREKIKQIERGRAQKNIGKLAKKEAQRQAKIQKVEEKLRQLKQL